MEFQLCNYIFNFKNKNKMANKTVVVKQEVPQKKEKSKNVDEPEQTSEPIGESPISKTPEIDEDAPKNQAGQTLDKELTGEEDAYITSDGKIMIVQMEEEGQVFAGEHGRNAKWYPKDILNSWTKKS